MYIHNPSKPRQLEVCSHDYTVVLADVKTEIPLSVSLWRLMSTAVGPGWGLPDMGDKSPWVTAFCLVCARVSVSSLCILVVEAHSHSFSTFGLVFLHILPGKVLSEMSLSLSTLSYPTPSIVSFFLGLQVHRPILIPPPEGLTQSDEGKLKAHYSEKPSW